MNIIAFKKWCKRIKRALEIVRFYTHKPADFREAMYEDYKDVLLIKKQYELLRLSLDENELKTLDEIIEKRQNEMMRCNPFFLEVFNNWCLIMFPNNESQIETLDRKDMAFEITKLRIERGYNREEVAGLIKIHPVSLKEYEEGIMLIPIDKLYSLLFVYDVELNKFLDSIPKKKIKVD